MAQTFPNSPSTGTVYTVNNTSWKYDGSGWIRTTLATAIPGQTGNSGKYLTTDGSNISWSTVLPSQTGNSGKYLTTDGTTSSWGTVAAAVPKITSIPITDSSYTVLDDTAVSTAGGYIKIIGTGFTTGSQVLIGTVLATSVSFISSTELRAQVPATAAGTYVVYVVATDGAVAIRINGITFSATPTWTTASNLGTYSASVSIQLAATSDSTLTYSLAAGSTIPTGLSLSSSGLLSGTVTGVSADITYNFTITATDIELQDSPRTFSITLTIKDPYFPNVPLLLETAASSTRSTTVVDSSTTALTVTRNGTVATGWTSPYQTNGYWSNYFVRASSQYLTVSNPSSQFSFGTGALTIECWVNLASLPSSTGYPASYWMFGGGPLNSNPGIDFYINNTQIGFNLVDFTSPTAIGNHGMVVGSWYHVAVVRGGTSTQTVSIYVNGTRVATATSVTATADPATTGIAISAAEPSGSTGGNFDGYISNYRVVKGTAVYDPTLTTLTVPTTPLTAITNTSLLTCQSNRFIDNSTDAFAITVTGTPQVRSDYYPSTFPAPAASLGAGLFNGGTADYIVNSSTSVGAFGSNNFTVEAWVYPTIALTGTLNTIITTLPSSTNSGWHLFYTNTGFGIRSNLVNYTQSSTVLPSYAWSHIAWCRNGTTYYLYLNGKQLATSTTLASWTDTYLAMGQTPFGSNNILTGYIANVRLVNGLAVYAAGTTGNQVFTPPSDFLTQTGGTYPSTTNITNPSASQTTLLVNFADSNYTSATNAVQNNTFIDSSNYAWLITRVGTATQGSFTPYWPNGYWSNYFNGTTDYLTTTITAAGTGSVTYECWFNTKALASGIILNSRSGNTADGIDISVNASGKIVITYQSVGLYTGGNFTIAIGTWYHLAVVRNGASGWTIYINGQIDGTFSNSVNITSTTFTVGLTPSGSSYFGGYVSNVRVANSAIYTSAFTSSTTPLTAITNTQLLTCQSNRFVDNNTQVTAKTITLNGTPQTQAFQPFSPSAPYTTAAYGGSIYNTVKTDGLSATSVAGLTTFTGDFTIDCWVYPTDTSVSSWGIIDTRTSGQTANPWVWYLVSYSAGWNLQFFNGSYNNFTTKIQANCWTHVVLQRNGSTLRAFVNGVVDATTFTISGTITGGSSTISINNIKDSSLAGTGNVGYTSNLRIVNGTAVYATTGFTPPTAPVTAIANTSLLLNYTNAGIYDAAVQNNQITYSSAQASTTIYKFSPTSMKFNGTTDYLSSPVIPAYSFGTGDFTVEGWFYFNAFNTAGGGDHWMVSLGQGYSAGGPYNGWALRYNANSAATAFLMISTYNGTDSSIQFNLPTTNYLVINTWYHIACTRSGTSVRMFLNGTQVSTTVTSSAAFNAVNTDPLQVGKFVTGAGTFYHNGYMQDVRVTKGYARYTANFTPTTYAFQTR